MKFTASRLSEGNKVFPAEIGIDDHGVTVRIPGLFGGRTTHLDFQNIGNVSISTPAVGYSTITFHASGSHVTAHGFTTGEARQIKQAIDAGRSALGDRRGGRDRSGDQDREFEAWKMRREQEHEREMAKRQARQQESVDKAELARLSDELAEVNRELIQVLEKQLSESVLHPWKDDANFRDKEAIANIQFPSVPSDIVRTIERIVRDAIKQIKKLEQVEDHHLPRLSDPEFWKVYQEKHDLAEVACTKAREGLKAFDTPDFDTVDDYLDCMVDMHELIVELEKKWLPILEGLSAARQQKKNG